MYQLTWRIKIGKYLVKALTEVKIVSSVLNLSDTASIKLPGKFFNQWALIEDKIKVGDPVIIQLGYNQHNQTEFNGYLKAISRDNDSLVLECEDELYALRAKVHDKEYKDKTIQEILRDLVNSIDSNIQIECDYDYTPVKLIVFHETALDVLNRIHEETKANIYFVNKVLHVHPVYGKNSSQQVIIFNTEKNIQKNELKWKSSTDKDLCIKVSYTNEEGDLTYQTFGNGQGQTITKYSNSSDSKNIRTAANNEFSLWNYDGYEGSFTAWLQPQVRAGDSVQLVEKGQDKGKYYVTGIEVTFGQSGAKRKISLGRRVNN